MKNLFFIAVMGFFAYAFAARTSYHLADPVTPVIFWVTIIFLLGVIGRKLALWTKQPGVVGELVMGIVVGNIFFYFGSPLIVVLREGSAIFNIISELLAGTDIAQAVSNNIHDVHYAAQVVNALSVKQSGDIIKVAYTLDIFSRYGIIFLLFMVGLETTVEDLGKTGRESILVALIGVFAPIVLGFILTTCFLPSLSFKSDLFIATTLCATSVGITAKVLEELKITRTREARTILGAAMLDDILGLVILAIVSSLVISGVVNIIEVGYIIISALLFFSCALLFGPWIIRKVARFFTYFEPWQEKLCISFVFSMGLAWMASLVNLAPIIGAFAAGIIMNDDFFRTEKTGRNALSVKELIAPIELLFTPLFFMVIGLQVKLESFWDLKVILIAFGLIVAAVVGKLLSGCGGNSRDDRLFIGIGMLPRGEVGLVFATIGRGLGVISDSLFSAIILMVVVTTLVAPPLLKARYAKKHVPQKAH